jgi:hypothetical protein
VVEGRSRPPDVDLIFHIAGARPDKVHHDDLEVMPLEDAVRVRLHPREHRAASAWILPATTFAGRLDLATRASNSPAARCRIIWEVNPGTITATELNSLTPSGNIVNGQVDDAIRGQRTIRSAARKLSIDQTDVLCFVGDDVSLSVL